MPKYVSDVPRWLSHECRMVQPGEEFVTEFPKVKVNGELVDMKLSSTLHLVDDEPEAHGKKGHGKGGHKHGEDLV